MYVHNCYKTCHDSWIIMWVIEVSECKLKGTLNGMYSVGKHGIINVLKRFFSETDISEGEQVLVNTLKSLSLPPFDSQAWGPRAMFKWVFTL